MRGRLVEACIERRRAAEFSAFAELSAEQCAAGKEIGQRVNYRDFDLLDERSWLPAIFLCNIGLSFLVSLLEMGLPASISR
jgi:hypothetical protein